MFLIIIILMFSNSNSLAYQVCNISHNVDSGVLEDACGILLDATNTIYLCNKTGDNCYIKDLK